MQHGGSGLGLSRTEVLDMPWPLMRWYVERLGREREAEAEAIRKHKK